MSDKVSIVVPIYKVEQYICNILESIVKQSYKNLELILVDDGTPDRSIEIAQEYLSDKAVDWKVVREPNSGLPTARNTGIAAATGKWVICPDSDDYLATETIETMVAVAQNTHSRCVFCGYKVVHDCDLKEGVRSHQKSVKYPIEELRRLFLWRKLILLVPGMLMERTVYDNLKYEKDCPYDEDIHFMWQLLYKIDDIAYIGSDFYNYYMRSNSMVHTLKPEAYLTTSQRYAEMTSLLCEQYPEDYVAPKIYPKYRLGGAHVFARANDFDTFRNTVLSDGYRKDMGKLIFQKDIKLAAYALLFCTSLKLFYQISRK